MRSGADAPGCFEVHVGGRFRVDHFVASNGAGEERTPNRINARICQDAFCIRRHEHRPVVFLQRLQHFKNPWVAFDTCRKQFSHSTEHPILISLFVAVSQCVLRPLRHNAKRVRETPANGALANLWGQRPTKQLP